LDRSEVLEDIGVVELDVVDHSNIGQVMDELAALIEESRIVLVAFDDKPITGCESRALAEVVRNAADEKTGVETVMFKNPGQQRSRRCFAVCAGHDQGTLATDELFLEQLRQRTVA